MELAYKWPFKTWIWLLACAYWSTEKVQWFILRDRLVTNSVNEELKWCTCRRRREILLIWWIASWENRRQISFTFPGKRENCHILHRLAAPWLGRKICWFKLDESQNGIDYKWYSRYMRIPTPRAATVNTKSTKALSGGLALKKTRSIGLLVFRV